MTIIGIDPGLDGGIAVLRPDENPDVLVMPTMPTGKGTGREIDIAAIQHALTIWGEVHIAVEGQQPFPKQGGKSNFTTGYNYGKLLGWLEAVCLPFRVVTPREWQRAFGIGGRGTDTKAQAALVCRRLFPCVDLLATARCRKAHSGKADSLLIAEWCRRTQED